MPSAIALRMRCARCHADFCVISKSRCKRMDETPLRLIVTR